MDREKILIVSASFFPGNSPRSFRTTELAKEFARMGHYVRVITPRIDGIHSDFELKYGLEIRDLGKRRFPEIVSKGRGLVKFVRRAITRTMMLLFEYPNIELFWMVKKALKAETGYDLMISVATPYPVHWGVAAVRSEKHRIARVWVADCGDPYVGRENDSFRVPFYFRYVEKWFMRKADFIAVPTSGAINAYFSEFHKKIRVIPQGFDFNEYAFANEENINLCPTFAYAGMFIPGRRDPSEFIEFLQQQDRDFRFHIFTKTPQHIPEIKDTSKARVIIHEPIPRHELLAILSRMDFLVNFENAGSRQTPSKLIDYLILKKPILSIRTGHLDRSLATEFLAGNYERKLVIPEEEQYHIENVCNKFLQLLDIQ